VPAGTALRSGQRAPAAGRRAGMRRCGTPRVGWPLGRACRTALRSGVVGRRPRSARGCGAARPTGCAAGGRACRHGPAVGAAGAGRGSRAPGCGAAGPQRVAWPLGRACRHGPTVGAVGAGRPGRRAGMRRCGTPRLRGARPCLPARALRSGQAAPAAGRRAGMPALRDPTGCVALGRAAGTALRSGQWRRPRVGAPDAALRGTPRLRGARRACRHGLRSGWWAPPAGRRAGMRCCETHGLRGRSAVLPARP